MNLQQFKQFSKEYTAVPVYRRLPADIFTPVSLFLNIREEGEYPFLLESVEGGQQLARYSFLGRDPYQVLRYENNEVTLQRNNEVRQLQMDYFTALKQLTSAHEEPKIPELPRLSGGAVGFSGYDTVRDIENLPDQPNDDRNLPDAVWAFYDQVYAFDHVKQQVLLIKTVLSSPSERSRSTQTDVMAESPSFTGPSSDNDASGQKQPVYQSFNTAGSTDLEKQFRQVQSQLDEMEQQLYQQPYYENTISLQSEEAKSNVDRETFIKSVEDIKRYIHEGEIFQAVISQRFESTFSDDRFLLYRALRMVNPSPYLFFLDFGDLALAGSSPEVLSRLQNDKATLLPIAGTRARGEDQEEDQALEDELKNDPKEQAEHLMLVDLGRNDLSRVCKPGSVQPVKNRVVVRYSHVMHLVSELQGRLKKDKTAVDLLAQTFPAGTVSGAPKIRAMEIIDELETSKRGPYAGAVGYFDFSGNMDTCIAIRTMVISDEKVYVQAGAGIVADSDPAKEYLETKNKAAALMEALNVALEINR